MLHKHGLLLLSTAHLPFRPARVFHVSEKRYGAETNDASCYLWGCQDKHSHVATYSTHISFSQPFGAAIESHTKHPQVVVQSKYSMDLG